MNSVQTNAVHYKLGWFIHYYKVNISTVFSKHPVDLGRMATVETGNQGNSNDSKMPSIRRITI